MVTTSAARAASSVSGLGISFGNVDADFGHGRHDGRVDLGCRVRTRRAHQHPAGGVVLQ
jgi:hypothetical protein